jgi:glutamate formiminotransferase/formiminotetrahydrofolate cyclodeaminase
MAPLIECVPNFSEGRNPEVIRRITERISSVEGATLLHVDSGKATNRTVVTIAGDPEAVVEAAFRAIREAGELIDMRHHSGEHPRMGATDVCPLVPISGISMEEAAKWSRRLAERVGKELGIPVYLYEAAQPRPERRNLAVIRAGEYEGLADKLRRPEWRPDCGPAEFNPRSGATVIGARGFLVAYNVNLNTTSTRRANAIAFDVREAGRPRREADSPTGKVVVDASGQPVMIPGALKAVKAIGWYIPEYGVAQVSMNLTDLSVTSIHTAFDEVCRAAEARGVRVTGSELVGLVPLSAMVDAGRHYLRRQKRSTGVPEAELVRIAVKSLGLSELAPFHPEERIIEYRLRDVSRSPLVGLSVEDFATQVASETPAPGGGSVAALLGALGASLGAMVANLSSHKRGWDDRWEEFSAWADRGEALKVELLALVDEDTRAFQQVMAALALPKGTAGEKAARSAALAAANQLAIEVPFRTMQRAAACFDLIETMVREGNPASASDGAVGGICVAAAIKGAWLNVRTNVAGLKDKSAVAQILEEGERLVRLASEREAGILSLASAKFAGGQG